MLKRVVIPNYGPFVFGRLAPGALALPRFTAPSSPITKPAPIDHDAIRAAAKSLHPIYRAEEDVLANDRYGDCTCAAMLHIGAILQGLKGGLWRLPTASDAVWLYSQVTSPPFDPTTGANDNGADLATVIRFCQANGAFADGSLKIGPPSAVDASDANAVRAALDSNRILYMGAGLPKEWIPTGPTVPKVWDVAGPPDDQDGHCTAAYSYNDVGVQIDTWGDFLTITWAALAKYYAASAGGELYTFGLAA